MMGYTSNVLRVVFVLLFTHVMNVDAHGSKSPEDFGIANKPIEKILEPVVIRVTGYAAFSVKDEMRGEEASSEEVNGKEKNSKTTSVKTNSSQTNGSHKTDSQTTSRETQRLLAIRASKLDAYRALAERIYGIGISGSSTVKDFALQSDGFAAIVESYVRGARVVSVIENKNTGMETVLEVLLPGDFQDCLNKVNNFKYGLECLQPLMHSSFNNVELDQSQSGKGQAMQSMYFLK